MWESPRLQNPCRVTLDPPATPVNTPKTRDSVSSCGGRAVEEVLGSEGASLGHTVLPTPSGTRSPTGWPAVQAGVSTERRRPVCVRQSRRKPKAWRVNVWGAEPRTEAVVSLQCRRSREHPGTQPPGPPPSWSSFAARSPRVAWEGTGGRGPGLLRSPHALPRRPRALQTRGASPHPVPCPGLGRGTGFCPNASELHSTPGLLLLHGQGGSGPRSQPQENGPWALHPAGSLEASPATAHWSCCLRSPRLANSRVLLEEKLRLNACDLMAAAPSWPPRALVVTCRKLHRAQGLFQLLASPPVPSQK